MENMPNEEESQNQADLAPSHPVQVEQIGKVKTKLGTAMRLNSLMVWLLGGTVLILLLSIVGAIFHDPTYDFGSTLIFSVAMLVPVLPLFIFLNRRLNRHLKEDPNALSDIYYYKSARFHMIVFLVISLLWAIALVYNILDKLFLHGIETGYVIADSLVFVLVPVAMTLFFYHYYNKAKR
jgi:hypothetical protein